MIPSPTIKNNTGGVDRLRQYVIFELVDVTHNIYTSPQSTIFPYLVLHVNPESFEESYTKLITRQITRGGYVEQHWGEELDIISCSGSTGMFVTIRDGVSALNRKASIAYQKYIELVSLYQNNGLVYDQRGNPIFKGAINLHLDGNIFQGYFENMTVSETAEKPFTFDVNFSFKVEHQYRSVGN